MAIKLTTEQKKHIDSIRWLFKGAFGSGRTTLLAYVLIETVLETGQTMRIQDHHPSKMADLRLAGTIDQIIQREKLPLMVNKDGSLLSRT